MEKEVEIKRVISNYLTARRALFELEKKYPNELSGNDNIIGRIGEYVAIRYLENKGRKVQKNNNRSQKGHDLKSDNKRISVKIMTIENKRGRSVRMTFPWDELIFILLDADYKIFCIGHLYRKDFARYLRDNSTRSKNPIIDRRMLNEHGLFGKYGEINKDKKFLSCLL